MVTSSIWIRVGEGRRTSEEMFSCKISFCSVFILISKYKFRIFETLIITLIFLEFIKLKKVETHVS